MDGVGWIIYLKLWVSFELMSLISNPYATSVLLPEHMETFARSIALGSRHNPVWLHASVLLQCPLFQRVHLMVVNSTLEASILLQGVTLPLKGNR